MSADESRTIFFICRHGAAKSVLAAADLRSLAAARGIPLVAEAAGVEPSERFSPVLVRALADDGVDVGQGEPRRFTESALVAAWRVITFNLDPKDLPTSLSASERWDDVPALSDDFEGARAAIGRHLERLIEGL